MSDKSLDEVIAQDIPKLLDNLANIKELSNSLNQQVQIILQNVKNGKLATSNGVSLLDVKYNFMLRYIIDILMCIDCKVNGNSINEHSAIGRIVECRTTLEKTRPLEQKLRYQIDKILQGSSGRLLHKDDPLQFKPELDNFEAGSDVDDQVETEQKTDKYVPPHIAAMKYDEEEEDSRSKKSVEKSRQRALQSSLIAELVQDAVETPMEISHHSQTRTKVLKQQEERNKFEEEYMTRVSLDKRQRAAERRGLRQSELDTISKFGNIGALEGHHEDRPIKRKVNKSKARKRFKSKKRKF